MWKTKRSKAVGRNHHLESSWQVEEAESVAAVDNQRNADPAYRSKDRAGTTTKQEQGPTNKTDIC